MPGADLRALHTVTQPQNNVYGRHSCSPAEWVRAGEFYGSSALLRVPSVVNKDERKDEPKSGQWRSRQSAHGGWPTVTSVLDLSGRYRHVAHSI